MRYVRNQEVSSATLDDEVCMFESAKSKYYNLNKTGTFIWEILDNPKTFNECLDSISKFTSSLDKNLDKRIKGISAEPNILFRLESVGSSK